MQPQRRRDAETAAEKKTFLCVPIFVTDDLAKARRDIAAAVQAGAEMIELRIDPLGEASFLPLLKDCSVPVIVTCRPTREGGMSDLSDEQRLNLLIAAAEDADYVDVELKTALAQAELFAQVRAPVVLSVHDFSSRPNKLYNVVNEMNGLDARINKIVWTARSIRDNVEAFELLQSPERPTIALCMGEAGLISRVLAKKFGAFLTYASLSGDEATAPGQAPIDELNKLYRWNAIGTGTKVYGVVAHPVGHSMSPAIHNAAFDALGYDGVYLPMLVEPSYESFKAFMETFVNFAPLDLSGLSVTIPHKENALRYLQGKNAEIEELARRIGAVNTIKIDSGKLRGSNTDYSAMLDSITQAAGIGRDGLKDLRFGVIGAGGAGRTAVAALAHYGAAVQVCDYLPDRATALAEAYGGRGGKVTALELRRFGDCDVWMNASPVGMHPHVDQSPLGDHEPRWSAKTIVFDVVYNPMKTKFLAQAEAARAKTISGVEMFVRQAAAQFELWTGRPAPGDLMRRVVETRLTHP